MRGLAIHGTGTVTMRGEMRVDRLHRRHSFEMLEGRPRLPTLVLDVLHGDRSREPPRSRISVVAAVSRVIVARCQTPADSNIAEE